MKLTRLTIRLMSDEELLRAIGVRIAVRAHFGLSDSGRTDLALLHEDFARRERLRERERLLSSRYAA